jgi:glutamate/aspartate transport system substrate-binding protein
MKASIKIAAAIAAGMCTITSAVDAQTLKKVADTNRIAVSYRESATPFSYVATAGKPVGFAVDLTEAIVDGVRRKLDKPNLEVAWIPVTGQTRIPQLVNGTYDLECGSTTNTTARNNDVAFTISHFYTGTRVLVKKASNIRDYADLAGKTVAVVGGSTNEKVLRKYGEEHKLNLRFVLGEDYADAFRMVESDQAAAFATDDILLFGLRANSANPALFDVVGATLQVEPYGCMVRKGDPEFKALADETIARLMRSGEFARMYAKWFEQPIPPKGVTLGMPMNEQLRANLTALSDKPAF